MSASAIRELINAKFKPSADEIDYTRAYNDGADVDARGYFTHLKKISQRRLILQKFMPQG